VFDGLVHELCLDAPVAVERIAGRHAEREPGVELASVEPASGAPENDSDWSDMKFAPASAVAYHRDSPAGSVASAGDAVSAQASAQSVRIVIVFIGDASS
jgi:hypothetical protein